MHFALALVMCAMPFAHAQLAVVDVAAIGQLINQVRTLEAQLLQAQAQLESMTGPRGMERLLRGQLRNYLPADWVALTDALTGAGNAYGELVAQIRAAINDLAVLTDADLALLSVPEREQLEAARRDAATLQVMARTALETTSARFDSLQELIDAIPQADDQKAILDLQARIAAEQGMLQNESSKLNVLYQATQAQEWARRQRTREQALSGIGSLRELPPLGL